LLERLRALLRRLDRYRPYRLARVLATRPLGPQGKRFLGVLLAGIVSITVWQEGFGGGGGTLDPLFKTTAASGVHYDRNFTYFLYYLNLFPVASTLNSACINDTQTGCWDTAGTPADYTYEAAKNVLMRNGKTLQQDLGWT